MYIPLPQWLWLPVPEQPPGTQVEKELRMTEQQQFTLAETNIGTRRRGASGSRA